MVSRGSVYTNAPQDVDRISRQSSMLSRSALQTSFPGFSQRRLFSQRRSALSQSPKGGDQSNSDQSYPSEPPNPGYLRRNAQNLGVLRSRRSVQNHVGESDSGDCYQFQINGKKNLRVRLGRLQADADLQLLNHQGRVIYDSVASGSLPENIRLTLRRGKYYLRVFSYDNEETSYSLNLRARSFEHPGRNVPDDGDGKADWTVMVYMASSNLEYFAIEDFYEMAAIGSNRNVNIVTQIDRTGAQDFGSNVDWYDDTRLGNWTGTRRGLVRAGDIPDGRWGTSLGEVNMGDANALADFVQWGTSTYQADRYALVLWGHGDGFNLVFDEQTADPISASELGQVLGQFSKPIDLVGADSCLMGMTEFASGLTQDRYG